jgi:hypothetical protein
MKHHRLSLIYLLLCLPVPFMLGIYACGLFDGAMSMHMRKYRVTERKWRRMTEVHKRVAWNVMWAEVIAVLIALAAWAIATRAG